MLKSPKTKYRRLKNRLFISVLTISLLFSYSLKNNDFKADTTSYDTNGYSITTYNEPYDYWSSGTISSSKYRITARMHLIITFREIMSGQFNFVINNLGYPRNALVSVTGGNLYMYSISSNNISSYIQFNGVNYIEIVFQNVNEGTGNINQVLAPLYPTLASTWSMTNLVTQSASYMQTLLNIKNSIYNIENYVDQVEANIMNAVGELQYVHNNTTDIKNSMNNLLTKADTIAQNILDNTSTIGTKIDTLGTKLDDIKTAINNIDLNPTGSQINVINNYETQLDIVNNIEGNLIADLDNEIINNKKGYEYIRDVIKNSAKHNEAKSILDVYVNEFKGAWNADQYIFNDISWYILMAVAFALIRVVIG